MQSTWIEDIWWGRSRLGPGVPTSRMPAGVEVPGQSVRWIMGLCPSLYDVRALMVRTPKYSLLRLFYSLTVRFLLLCRSHNNIDFLLNIKVDSLSWYKYWKMQKNFERANKYSLWLYRDNHCWYFDMFLSNSEKGPPPPIHIIQDFHIYTNLSSVNVVLWTFLLNH